MHGHRVAFVREKIYSTHTAACLGSMLIVGTHGLYAVAQKLNFISQLRQILNRFLKQNYF